jgi:hypothetical protein
MSEEIVPYSSRVIVEKDDSEEIVFRGSLKSVPVQRKISIIKSKRVSVVIAGKKHNVTREEIAREIKYITQTIGEYKDQSSIMSDIMVGALRKARADLVSLLETKFNVSWQLIDNQSEFFEI